MAPMKLTKHQRREHLFDDWIRHLRTMNKKYMDIDLSLHSATEDKTKHFLMFSQPSIVNPETKNKVMAHYTMLPSLINEIKRFQEILFKLNNDSEVEVEVEAEVETEEKVPHDELTKSIDEVTLNEYQHEMIPIYASLLLSWFY
eukprot:TCONS_00045288-protein